MKTAWAKMLKNQANQLIIKVSSGTLRVPAIGRSSQHPALVSTSANQKSVFPAASPLVRVN